MSKNKNRAPTLNDVAAAARVSVATVSHVLNPESAKFVSDELRQRVTHAAETLSYRPNYLARGMRGKRRRTIAILVPQFENILFTMMIMAAEQVAYNAGYVLLICSTYDLPERERVYIESLLSQQVDGLILSPTMAGTVNTRDLRERGCPYVVVDRRLPRMRAGSYDYVGFDNRRGAELATQFLIDHGHRRIGFLGWRTRVRTVGERYLGFRASLAHNGLDPAACPSLFGPHSREEGERLSAGLLGDGKVTAIFAAHQYLGEGVLQAARRLGKALPRDLSLVVFGQPAWTELTDPPITSIRMPDSELGERAARLLIDRIEGRGAGPEYVVIEPTIAVGGSVAFMQG